MKYLTPTMFAVLLSCSSVVVAQEFPIEVQHLERMGFTVESVSDSDIDGLYEVITDQGLFYASADGEKLISGRIFDIAGEQPRNISDEALAEMRQADIAGIADSLITYPAADEKYRVTVFTDTTCGYCRQLHERIDTYNELGITIQYAAFPRGGLRSEGAQKLAQVWCAEDPKAAMNAAKNDAQVATRQCAAPIEEHYTLGQKFGVRGTPAVVFENGYLMPGYRPPQALLEELKAQ